MHSGGQEKTNKLLNCVWKGKEKNVKNIKMPLYKLKAQTSPWMLDIPSQKEVWKKKQRG